MAGGKGQKALSGAVTSKKDKATGKQEVCWKTQRKGKQSKTTRNSTKHRWAFDSTQRWTELQLWSYVWRHWSHCPGSGKGRHHSPHWQFWLEERHGWTVTPCVWLVEDAVEWETWWYSSIQEGSEAPCMCSSVKCFCWTRVFTAGFHSAGSWRQRFPWCAWAAHSNPCEQWSNGRLCAKNLIHSSGGLGDSYNSAM